MVQSICVNISEDIYQTIMLCQFLEKFFTLKMHFFLFLTLKKMIGIKMIELINQPSNIASQPLDWHLSQSSGVCWYFFSKNVPGILERETQSQQTSLQTFWKTVEVENMMKWWWPQTWRNFREENKPILEY